ncbi:EI24 domain-containing protein [Sphingomonas sp. PB4P5]|uniref:EI24 domain-containing protein n=1 Tax=Parasphingomonas puruogangriensis TaxID=3096155 RepID=UPI002FC5A3FA
MIRAFFLSIGQLCDRRILAVFLKSLALTIALLAALGLGAWYALTWLAAYWGWGSGAQSIAGMAAVVLALVAAGVLFRAVAVLVIGVFADDVVKAVEARHYPQALASARDVPLARSLAMGLGSVGRFVLINLLLLPAYIVLLVTGVGPAILFFLVNGWLLGRDLGDMVAARHLGASELKGWRGATALSRFALGLIGTGLFVVPIVNLAAPVIVAAMATHWFHQGRRK